MSRDHPDGNRAAGGSLERHERLRRALCRRVQQVDLEIASLESRRTALLGQLDALGRDGRDRRDRRDGNVVQASFRAPAGEPSSYAVPFRLAHLEVIPRRQAVVMDGRLQHLSRTEWLLFTQFLDHAGRALTREELADGAWGPGYGNRENQVEVYVSRLRGKLESPDPSAPRLFHTVRGVGYAFVPPATGPEPRDRARLRIVQRSQWRGPRTV